MSDLRDDEIEAIRDQRRVTIWKNEAPDGTDTFVHWYPDGKAILLRRSPEGDEVWLRDHELNMLADQLETAKREAWEAK